MCFFYGVELEVFEVGVCLGELCYYFVKMYLYFLGIDDVDKVSRWVCVIVVGFGNGLIIKCVVKFVDIGFGNGISVFSICVSKDVWVVRYLCVICGIVCVINVCISLIYVDEVCGFLVL